QARHPLIPQDQIVPVDVWLGGSDTNGFTTLVITGPNTGGKTVSLKTVGLLSLMAASGLHIPCASESRACVFDEIFADIGDEQSIEQSLSTFSSHLRNIVGLLGKSGPSVLVLLDELGAGTDPAEGAALAISILEHLHNSGAMTVATTHYSEVKAYALTAQGIENASMEFDVASLRPTYRMSIGIPGQSNAFAIAARLGMPSVVLERAKALMTGEEIHFEQVISSAQEQKLLAEKELHAARRIHDEAVTAREKTVNLERELKQKQDKILEQARLQAQAVLQQAKAQADRALSAAKAAKSQLSAEAIEALRTEGKGLEKAILENAPAPPDDEDGEPLGKVELGQRVRIIGTQTYGEVAALPDSKGNVSVQTQLGRMQVPLKKLCAPGEADVLRQKKPKFSNTRTVPVSAQKKVESHEATVAARQAGLSLDIRGMNVDEALPRIDAFLDQARMNNLSEVTIIHGKGTGALRAGVQSYLKSLRGITSRPGNYGEGDAGVTVVEV
ncbi:MAG: Smr/MutS family protein, partial [Clostridia bacterium]|nr:Smr/MutS family protein [Clostridia bacterium]